MKVVLYRQLSKGHTPLPTEKLLHVCEPAKNKGHVAHRSCHFQKAMTHLSQHSPRLVKRMPTHIWVAATDRRTKMWACSTWNHFHGSETFFFPPPSSLYRELRQYRLVTQQLSCWEIARRGMWAANSFFMAVYWDSTPTHVRTPPG